MKKKIIYLEVLRILAAFFVIINHTNAGVFQNVLFSATWSFSIIYFILCRSAVPIFFMVSGALLIKKSDTYHSLGKRIFQAFYPLLIASIFYYLTGPQYQNKSIVDFLVRFYSSKMTNSLWYMYAYIALLLMLPFIRSMIQHFNKKEFYYYFSLTFIFSALIPPFLVQFDLPSIFDKFQLPMLSMYLAYFIAGHFFVHVFKPHTKNYIYCIVVLHLSSILGTFFAIYHDYQKNPTGFFLFWNEIEHFNIAIMSITFFLIIKYIFSTIKLPPIFEQIILTVSNATFGIYLISDYIIRKFYFLYTILGEHINKFIAMLLVELLIFIICFTVVFIYTHSKKQIQSLIKFTI